MQEAAEAERLFLISIGIPMAMIGTAGIWYTIKPNQMWKKGLEYRRTLSSCKILYTPCYELADYVIAIREIKSKTKTFLLFIPLSIDILHFRSIHTDLFSQSMSQKDLCN